MTPERWQQVKSVLDRALSLSAAERMPYLDQTCAGDAELRQEVDSLLAAGESAGARRLDTPAFDPKGLAPASKPAAAREGRRVGAYLLLEEVGRGGMGEVFRAVRADGQYDQQVALKLVRSGYDSVVIFERFRNERQILAGLDHPNIARLLDGGTTPEGVPYLVMELVEGVPIDSYCDARRLSVTERLRLFLQVCSAVQYAHQHLVIHRDIKPNNILVTQEGTPKLLDFGIAKILDAAGSTEVTQLRPFTPEYASPEQVRGDAVSTATDLYSLAVVLYRLLTGRSPYRVEAPSPAKLAEAITSQEPERPSRSVEAETAPPEEEKYTSGAVHSTREPSPLGLRRRIRGDLDFILLKALRKEPQERYLSVEQFADDIRRHLQGFPIAARKGTWSYRAGRFVRRHRAGVAAAALVLATLVAGVVMTWREARIAEANRQRAERRFQDVHKLADSLMFEVHDSIRDLPGATAARKLIIERAQQYLDSLAQDAHSDPALLRDLAAAYMKLASLKGNPRDANLGDSAGALQNYRKAVELLTACVALEPSNPDNVRQLAGAYRNLSLALSRTKDASDSESAALEAVALMEPLAKSHPLDEKAQDELGSDYESVGAVLADRNDLVHARDFYERSLAVYEQLAKANPANRSYQTEVSFAHKHLGAVCGVQKQFQPALEHYRAALAIDEENLRLDPDNVQKRYFITYSYSDLGWVLNRQGDFDGALRYYERALKIREAMAAADPQDMRTRRGLALTHNYMAEIFLEMGDFSAALRSYRKALVVREALAQADPANEALSFELAYTQAHIGRVYVQRATRTGATPAQQRQFCRVGTSWIHKALPVFLERNAKGRLFGLDANLPGILTADVGECDRIALRAGRVATTSPR